MEERETLPDANRLSVLAALVLLAYALTPFVRAQIPEVEIPLPGAVFSFNVSFNALVSLLCAALTAVGMFWLLEDHPTLEKRQRFQHVFIPALTAWAIGTPLGILGVSLQWWVVFLLGGLLLMAVIVAEYVVVDVESSLHSAAMVGLTAVSFVLFLILAIAVRAAGLRLYLVLPPLAPAIFLVTMRTLYLRSGGSWLFGWGTAVSLVVIQLALALHYWQVSPVRYGLLLLGAPYGLTALAAAVYEDRRRAGMWVESVVMTGLVWLLAFILG